jgi:mannose-6-phosphate isomerase-like protein (cupin superfamily)
MIKVVSAGGNMHHTSSPLKAFKRAPSLEFSMWYKGSLTTNLADKNNTNGAFCLVEAILVPGNEPPPHVHSREDELFYVLEGEFDVYVGADAFKVDTGACIFLPKGTPHAFVIRSPRLRLLTLFTPAGLEDAFRGLSVPAQRLDLPTGALTYATVDVTQTAQRLREYDVRLLAPEEVADPLLVYPKSLPPHPGTRPRMGTDSAQWHALMPARLASLVSDLGQPQQLTICEEHAS